MTPALHEWARRHGERLADEFLRSEQNTRDRAAEYFEIACQKNRLLNSLREPAYAAFRDRVRCREREGSAA